MKRVISGPWHGLRVFGLVAGILVFMLAATVLTVGWGLGVSALRRPLAQFSTMKPNTAIGIGALGLALVFSRLGGPLRLLNALFTGLAALVGVATLVEYALGWDAGIDELLFVDETTPDSGFPGRPAPLTASLLVLLSVGMTGAEAHGWRQVKTACSLLALLVTWTLLNGYPFAQSAQPGVLPVGSVAVHTVVALFAVALGAVAAQPGSWPVRTVFANNVGGTTGSPSSSPARSRTALTAYA